MKKKIFTTLVFATMVFSLVGCHFSSNVSSNIEQNISSDSTSMVAESTGNSVSVEWFDMTVESSQITQTYGNYTAAEGNQLIDVVVSLTSTDSIDNTFWSVEFMLDDPTDTELYGIPVQADLIGAEDVMPVEFGLAPDESVTYHIIYEIPNTSKDLSLVFVEYFDDGTEEGSMGELYTIPLGI